MGARREKIVTPTNAPVSPQCRREHYRPPVGVPLERRDWWGVPLSAVAHVLVVALFLIPLWVSSEIVPPSGAGGPGPAGGGGGGSSGARPAGSGSSSGERLHYVTVAPPPPASSAISQERQQPKPIPEPVKPPPKPVVEQPIQEVRPVAPPQPAAIEPSATTNPQLALAGAGTGDSGASGGAGPGSGGGVGTGTGTGRGSATGSGTGGGAGDIYPATPDFLVMPALPVPSKVRGRTIRLEFQLDAGGKITALKFNSTGDSGYDKELRARLMEYRFRPAHKADGTPVPSVYVTELTL